MGKSALESLVPPSNEKKSVAVACSRLLIREMEKFHKRNVRLSVGRLVATHVSGGDAIWQ